MSLQVSRDDGRLRIAVRDDGPGVAAATERQSSGNGVGLANTRARLEQLYGARQHFSVGDHPDGGALVEMTIPLRYEPPAG